MHVVRKFLIAGVIAACLIYAPAHGLGRSAGHGGMTNSNDAPGKLENKKKQSDGYVLHSPGVDSGIAFRQHFRLPKDPDSILHEILSRSEFQKAMQETPGDRFAKHLEQILAAILRWLAGKMGLGGSGGEFNPHSLWRVVEGLLIGAVLLLAIYLAKLLFDHFRDRISPFPEPASDLEAVSLYVSSSRLREESMNHARKGDYRTGLILMFRSVLAGLEERGEIAQHRGRTNREIIRSIPPNNAVKKALTRLVPIFDGVCYGNAPCGKAEYDRFLHQCTRTINVDARRSPGVQSSCVPEEA